MSKLEIFMEDGTVGELDIDLKGKVPASVEVTAEDGTVYFAKMAVKPKRKKFTIEMEDGGVMKGVLYPDIAPITCENFEKLAKSGFYDNLIFHRVIPGFMIQGGDPTGTGMGGSDKKIKGEFAKNGFDNPIPHKRGAISMARSMQYNSASSQFFICVADCEDALDTEYAAFGEVLEGMEVADAIVSVERNRADKPLKDIHMKTVKVEELD